MNKNPLAKEHISANEEQISNKIIKILARSLTKNYVGGDGQRRFHAKSHGLLKAGLTINALLAAEYRTAIFEPGKMYDVWVRFSNGFPEKTPDTKKGIRGMAIKILNVNGPCLEKDDMGFTQDILLTNVPILFPGKARLQPALIKLLFGTISQKIGGAFGILLSFRLGRLFKFINGGIQPASFLDIHYSSATAYLYGADKAIKWHAIPKSPAAGKFDKNDDADYLRKRLAADLSANEYEFGLHIQLQRDAITDPIEDASIEWTGPTIEIGTIKIDKQQFDFEERRLLEKQILFSPWYSVEDHRPLGSINRIRRTIYKAMSKLRKEQNDMG